MLLNIYRDEVDVNIQQYSLSLSLIFKGECEKLEEN